MSEAFVSTPWITVSSSADASRAAAAACESPEAMTFASRESKPGGTGLPSTTPESTRTPAASGSR